MILTGTDRLAGSAIWFFLFSIVHAARLGRGAMFVLVEMVAAALLPLLVGRMLPTDDDGRRLPRAGSTMIIMLAFVILASAAMGAAMAEHAAAVAARKG